MSYFSFQSVFHDWCNKSRGAYKRNLAANRKEKSVVAAAGFLSRYLNGSLLYVRRSITVFKMG